MCGAWVSAVGREGERTGLGSGRSWAGLAISSWADLVPGALFHFLYSFSISFSVFLICFISFAYLLKFDPNKFLKSSSIQHSAIKLVSNKFSKPIIVFE
jgi:hypothetical protein